MKGDRAKLAVLIKLAGLAGKLATQHIWNLTELGCLKS